VTERSNPFFGLISILNHVFLEAALLLSKTIDSTTFPLWSESLNLPFVRPLCQEKMARIGRTMGPLLGLIEVIFDIDLIVL